MKRYRPWKLLVGVVVVGILMYMKKLFTAEYSYLPAKEISLSNANAFGLNNVRQVGLNNTFHHKLLWKRGQVRKPAQLSSEITIMKEIKKRLKKASSNKIILIWGKSSMVEDYVILPSRRQCGKCEVSYDTSLIDDSRTGAVVHHFRTDYDIEMPRNRNPNHLHIFWNLESSNTLMKIYGSELDDEDEYGMNATMGYRVDSDFLMSYRHKLARDMRMGRRESIYKEIMEPKTKFALAVISNCGSTAGARMRYQLLSQLQAAGLRIDLYGDCFSRHIDGDYLFRTIPQYKFFFAYENSYHCKDYITEKMFDNALSHDSVPVVWGATKEDYITSAPTGSFIFAEDFETPRHLIDYLERLDQNDEEYLKYFRWRTLKPEDNLPFYNRAQGFCAICRALHGINADNRFNPRFRKSSMPMFSHGIAKRTIPSLTGFIFDSDNPECFDDMNSPLQSDYIDEDDDEDYE